MKGRGGVEVQLQCTLALEGVSGQVRDAAALLLGRGPMVPVGACMHLRYSPDA